MTCLVKKNNRLHRHAFPAFFRTVDQGSNVPVVPDIFGRTAENRNRTSRCNFNGGRGGVCNFYSHNFNFVFVCRDKAGYFRCQKTLKVLIDYCMVKQPGFHDAFNSRRCVKPFGVGNSGVA